MRRSLLGTAVAVLALAVPASTAARNLPRHGVLVPGRSLGGVRLGETPRAVRAALGSFYGVCRGCRSRTWFFTVRPFDEHGIAVEFARGRVSGLYTLWRPAGWHDTHGLALGAPAEAVQSRKPPLLTIACPGYTALVVDARQARTAYYLFDGRLWGFGLFGRRADPCR
ncbi:MAG TPA: hypothetical protein VE088_05085 [Gaiellaceae bacterium]|jgi:hypothetical protein|nr:hypothetical protein [Gaiellaceae bacterium]